MIEKTEEKTDYKPDETSQVTTPQVATPETYKANIITSRMAREESRDNLSNLEEISGKTFNVVI